MNIDTLNVRPDLSHITVILRIPKTWRARIWLSAMLFALAARIGGYALKVSIDHPEAPE